MDPKELAEFCRDPESNKVDTAAMKVAYNFLTKWPKIDYKEIGEWEEQRKEKALKQQHLAEEKIKMAKKENAPKDILKSVQASLDGGADAEELRVALMELDTLYRYTMEIFEDANKDLADFKGNYVISELPSTNRKLTRCAQLFLQCARVCLGARPIFQERVKNEQCVKHLCLIEGRSRSAHARSLGLLQQFSAAHSSHQKASSIFAEDLGDKHRAHDELKAGSICLIKEYATSKDDVHLHSAMSSLATAQHYLEINGEGEDEDGKMKLEMEKTDALLSDVTLVYSNKKLVHLDWESPGGIAFSANPAATTKGLLSDSDDD
jgi:hypothetical protein